MKENEAYNALCKYIDIPGGADIHSYGSGKGLRYFVSFLEQGEHFGGDAPDMLLIKDNEAIIIEHFEFDCYRVQKRKGSEARRELRRIQNIEDALVPTEEGISFHDEIRAESSYRDLINNVERSFNKHYSHIEMYRDNLKQYGRITDSMQVRVLFLLEDTSPLGIMAAGREPFNSNPCPVLLSHSKEFLDLLEQNPKVDYVLICSSAGEHTYIWFVDCAELEKYYEHVVDYKNMDFIHFCPQVIGMKAIIPREEK